MKSSKYYQKWLQIVSRSSDVLLFLMGYTLGKDAFLVALLILALKLSAGFIASQLVYKRLQAVTEEGHNELGD